MLKRATAGGAGRASSKPPAAAARTCPFFACLQSFPVPVCVVCCFGVGVGLVGLSRSLSPSSSSLSLVALLAHSLSLSKKEKHKLCVVCVPKAQQPIINHCNNCGQTRASMCASKEGRTSWRARPHLALPYAPQSAAGSPVFAVRAAHNRNTVARLPPPPPHQKPRSQNSEPAAKPQEPCVCGDHPRNDAFSECLCSLHPPPPPFQLELSSSSSSSSASRCVL